MVALYAAYVALNAANATITAALDRRAAARQEAARPRLPSQHGAAAAHMQDSAMVGQGLPTRCTLCTQTPASQELRSKARSSEAGESASGKTVCEQMRYYWTCLLLASYSMHDAMSSWW